MKVKELKRTVNVCWSPAEYYPVTIAAGSAAQQVDASFSSNSHLELYTLNLEEPGFDLSLKSSLQTQHRFQKLVWSGAGVVVGGCDGGLLEFYSAEKLLNNASDALIGSSTKHNGHVSSLDINPYQKNLLASGASESEIFIWDLNNTSQPMAPGNRSQPYEHVQDVAWNQQVQHIIGSTFASRCVVWDLRKNEPIMKLSDAQSRTRWRSLSWHPAVATQLCIASEDDQVPVIQLWDLRLASAPLVTLEGHHKGVMSLSWCKQDPDLLLTAGKDGRVLCWNPNNTRPGGELLLELSSQQQQWVFDVSWSPREAGLFAAASFDQQLAVHSLLAGSTVPQSAQSHTNIMESFGGAESFSALPAVASAASAPAPRAPLPPRAPLWLRRPARARFAFGGKLVTFEKCPQEGGQKLIYISQVVSEPELCARAAELDGVLRACLTQEPQEPQAADVLAEYCRQKGDAATDQHSRDTWFFLRANFLPTFRTEVLNLLGFKQDDIHSKSRSGNISSGETGVQHEVSALSRGESTETEAELSTDTSTDLSDAHTLIERKLASMDLGTSLGKNVVIPNGEDPTSQICRALVCGQLEEAVELCLETKRVADALIIASLGSQELLYKVQKYHLSSAGQDPVALVSGSLLLSRWELLVAAAAPRSWRNTLAAIVTHCEGEALSHYCEMLGDRLCREAEPALQEAAAVCYVCGASPEPLLALLPRADLALLARRAALARARAPPSGGKLESVLIEYASQLAAQGCLQSALTALEGVQQAGLRTRLERALGLQPPEAEHPTTHQTRRPSHTQTQSSQLRAQRRGHAAPAAPADTLYGGSLYEQPWQQASVATLPGAYPQPPTGQAQGGGQPARPNSVGPHTGGIATRSKYKVDPSVQSAPLYNQYSFNSSATSQTYGGYNSPLPDQYNPASSVPAQMTPALNPVPGQVNPAVNGGYYNPVQPGPEPAAPPVPSKPVAPGWNDPPMLTSKPKPKQEVAPQAPITHPLFGVEPPQHVPLAPVPQFPGQQQQFPGQQQQQFSGQQPQFPGQQPQFSGQQPPFPGQQPQFPGQQQQFPGQQQQFPGQQEQFPGQQQQFPGQQQQFPGLQPQYSGQQQPFSPQQYGQQYSEQFQEPYSAAQTYPQQTESPAVSAPPPVQKAPLPEEHLPLQKVLDGLRDECSMRATNPQMKRKLEDVQRRLEILYDLLREHKLSERMCSSLSACREHVGRGQLEAALQLTAGLAQGTDFAAAASFLPGLKVLFQLASQLQLSGTGAIH